MSLSKLNTDCLFSILGYLPTRSQVHLRLVNTLWCNQLEWQLHRHDCLLLHPANGEPPLWSNQIRCSRLFTINRHFRLVYLPECPVHLLVSFLRRLCPGIVKLHLGFPLEGPYITKTAHLLECLTAWQATLRLLVLPNNNGIESAFWRALASLTSLQHLALGQGVRLFGRSCVAYLRTTILPNLRSLFTVGTLQLLQFFRDAPHLRHLYTSTGCFYSIEYMVFPGTLIRKLHLLTNGHSGHYSLEVRLDMLSKSFPELETLSVDREMDQDEKRMYSIIANQMAVQFREV